MWILNLFGVLRRFPYCTGHITIGSWKGRGNQYIQFVRVLYCKLPTNGKQLPAFPLEAMQGSNPGLRGCGYSSESAQSTTKYKMSDYIRYLNNIYILQANPKIISQLTLKQYY